MNKQEASRILHPDTTAQAMAGYLLADPSGDTWAQALNKACEMGAEALRVEEKEASIVMKTRHTFRGPDYERPYCEACNHYVPDANAAFCCWCGARFVTFILPLPEEVLHDNS